MKIRVIANQPNEQQTEKYSNIFDLIGKEFEVMNLKEYKEDFTTKGEIQIYSESHKGLIVLNKNEYEIINAG